MISYCALEKYILYLEAAFQLAAEPQHGYLSRSLNRVQLTPLFFFALAISFAITRGFRKQLEYLLMKRCHTSRSSHTCLSTVCAARYSPAADCLRCRLLTLLLSCRVRAALSAAFTGRSLSNRIFWEGSLRREPPSSALSPSRRIEQRDGGRELEGGPFLRDE